MHHCISIFWGYEGMGRMQQGHAGLLFGVLGNISHVPKTASDLHVPLLGLHEGSRATGADNSRARLQLTSPPSPPSQPCTRRRWPSCSRWSCCCSSQQSLGAAPCPPPSCLAHVSVHDASFGRITHSSLHSQHLHWVSQACLITATRASNPCSILQKV